MGPAAAPVPAVFGSSYHDVTIPVGTVLPVDLETAVGSDISRVEQPVHAHLSAAVRMHGQTVIAQGSRVSGVVTDATRSAKVKGRAHVAVRFDSLLARGDAPGAKRDSV